MPNLRRPEVQVSLLFFVVGSLWIIFSDKLFLLIGKNLSTTTFTLIQSIKGCFFVSVVTLLIYFRIKALNRELIQSQEQYRDLFENTPNPMMVFDPVTLQFTNANCKALDFYGYSLQQIKNMTLADVRAEDNTRPVDSENKGNIYIHKRKNSEIRVCLETRKNITIQGKQACLLSVHDITELHEAKEVLSKREKYLDLILKSITDGFFIVDENLLIEKANEQFRNLIPSPVEVVEGQHLTNLFPGLRNSCSYQQYMDAIATKQSVHFEDFDENNNKWYSVSAYPYENGLTVFLRDITKEKIDEQNLFRNQQNMVGLINNTDHLIWSIDSDMKFFTYNDSFKRAYENLTNEELWIGKTALNEKFVQEWGSLYQRALNGEKFTADTHVVYQHSPQYYTAYFNPILNAAGKVVGAGCFLQNITERRIHEKKIEAQNKQLKEVAYVTSHLVRSPLANILGLAGILDEDDPLSPANREIIRHIKTSATRLDQAIRDMVKQTTTPLQ